MPWSRWDCAILDFRDLSWCYGTHGIKFCGLIFCFFTRIQIYLSYCLCYTEGCVWQSHCNAVPLTLTCIFEIKTFEILWCYQYCNFCLLLRGKANWQTKYYRWNLMQSTQIAPTKVSVEVSGAKVVTLVLFLEMWPRRFYC